MRVARDRAFFAQQCLRRCITDEREGYMTPAKRAFWHAEAVARRRAWLEKRSLDRMQRCKRKMSASMRCSRPSPDECAPAEATFIARAVIATVIATVIEQTEPAVVRPVASRAA